MFFIIHTLNLLYPEGKSRLSKGFQLEYFSEFDAILTTVQGHESGGQSVGLSM
jgi:hypothetical protein